MPHKNGTRRNFHSEMKNRIENRLYGTTRNKRRPHTSNLSPLNPVRQQRNYFARQNMHSRKRKRSPSKNSKANNYSSAHKKEYDPHA